MNVIFVIENDLVYRMIHDVPAKFTDLLIKRYQVKTVMLTWLHRGMFLAKQHSHSEVCNHVTSKHVAPLYIVSSML
jgi:hypothetical protein